MLMLREVALAQFLATLSGVLLWLSLAVVLHPLAFGELGFLFSISMLLSVVASLGLGKSILASGSPSPRLALYVTLFSSSLIGALVGYFFNPWAGLLVLGLSLFSLSFHLELASKNFTGYLKLWIYRSSLFLLPVFLYLWRREVWIVLFGLFLSHFLPAACVLSRVTMVTTRALSISVFWFMLSDLSAASIIFLDKLAVGYLFGMETLGIYYFCSRLFYLFSALPQTLFFYSLSTKSRELRSLSLTLPLFLLAAGLGFSFLLPFLLPDYSHSVAVFRLMLPAILPMTISQVWSAELLSEQRPASLASSHALVIPLQLLSVAVLGRRFGLVGLGASFLLSHSLLALLLVLNRRVSSERRKTLFGGIFLLFLLPILLTNYLFPRMELGRGYVKVEDLAMDTFVKIVAVDDNLEKARSAAMAALREIHRLEDLLSCEKEGTEIWRLNQSGVLNPSEEVYLALLEATRYAELSDGAFDPTIKPLVDLWMKKVRETGRLPSKEELEAVRHLVDWRALVVENRRISFRKENMQVTLGGIAKGYAVDRAYEILSSRVSAGMVQIGGEIRVFGKPWRIGIQHPRRPEEVLQVIELSSGAVSTSGDYVRVYFLGARRIHHIIDPRTGEPAMTCQSVTVVAERSVDADALSTAAFVLGPEKGKKLLENLRVHGLFVDQNGKIVETENWYLLLPRSL